MSTHLTELVNRSGFAFQMAVAHAVRSSKGQHPFSVAASEHPWFDPRTNTEGFVDLVLEAGPAVFVVECKRLDTDWVFLIDRTKSEHSSHVRCLWEKATAEGKRLAGWDDVRFRPHSPEAEFCVVDKKKGVNTLEHLAGPLVRSTDAIADEDMRLARDRGETLGVYVPLIVTSARLKIAHLELGEVSLADGALPDGTSFEEVPLVRFRKTLSTKVPPNAKARVFSQAAEERARTVLVVNAAELIKVLRKLESYVERPQFGGRFPWAD